MRYIDLRSDTVTQPTDEMRALMAKAAVGDDVYGDDPTVNELEQLVCQMLGKEAAMFVPSGTFGNQVCVMTHTRRGDEIILFDDSHILIHEGGAAALLSGVQTRTLPVHGRSIDIARLASLIRSDDIHEPPTGLICMENARSNGTVLSLESMREVKALAVSRGIPVHLDGARIFNAAIALGVDAAELAACTDSVTLCLSKGLCAPVGSVVAGSSAFIARARRCRKLMGGGMRQAGILAAAGIYALKHMVSRLAVDHENARYMAAQLSTIEGVKVMWDNLDINMVFFALPETVISSEEMTKGLLANGIKAGGYSGEYRFVANNDVLRQDIDRVVEVFRGLVAKK